MTTAIHESTLGRVAITTDGDALVALQLELETGAPTPAATAAAPPAGIAAEAARQLDAYLAGERAGFDLPLRPAGTPFEQDVWRALGEIPYGETWSYGQLAAHIGRPGSARAVGRANGRNPLWVVVPCHRVIGAGGALTGYAGGLELKRRLLELESEAVVGVRTTRIYCRPSCTPPRAPLARNTLRYPNPAAARAAGFRACKLCKPD
jgi:methylated-DNA-[protein]-cysteine S-methyltransferase